MIFQNCTHLKWDTVGFYFLEIINFREDGTMILRNIVKCCRMSVKKQLIRALEDADVVKVKEIIKARLELRTKLLQNQDQYKLKSLRQDP